MKRVNASPLLLIIVFGLFITCSLEIAGGSSDHGNAKIAGTVTDTANNTAASVTVRLLPEDYNPAADDFNPDSLTAVTDSTGYYEIENVPEGTYCLTGVNLDSALYLLKKSIAVDTSDIDTINAALHIPGKIIIPVDSSIWLFDRLLTAFIPGTNIYYKVTSLNDTIMLRNVPRGIHTVHMYSETYDSIIPIDKEFSNFSVISGVVKDFTLYPEKPRGPATGVINNDYQFNSIFNYKGWISNIAVQFIEYRFTWGEADTSDWSTSLFAIHSWSQPDTFEIRTQIRYIPNQIGITQEDYKTPFYSGWSEASFIVITNK